MPAGGSRLFISVKSIGPVSLDIQLLHEDVFHQKNVWEYLIINGSGAIVLIMGLYNFCIFLQLRKKIYLYYVFFALFFSLQAVGPVGMYRVFFENYTFISNKGFLLHSTIGLLTVYAFAYYFLELYSKPILGWVCKILSGITIINVFVLLFFYQSGIKMAVLASLILSLFCLVTGLVRSVQRFRPAYFYTIAWAAVLVANISRMLMLSGNLDPSPVIDFSVQFGLVFEAVMISLGLADKIRLREKDDFARISHLNSTLEEESKKVRDLNEHLEERVEEQTREIKSIMRNIQLGIMVIEGDELRVTDTYSEAAKEIFETQEIGGGDAIYLLLRQAQVTTELKDQIAAIISSSLDEDPIAFEANEHLLPMEMSFQFEKEKILQFDWKPVVDKDDLVEKIIVTVKDVTELKSLEQESKEREKELQFIGEILSTTPRKFAQFMEASINFIGDNRRLLQLNSDLSTESLKLLFINLHTIKGAARALNLAHLTPLVHDTEQMISEMMKGNVAPNRQICIDEHMVIDELLSFYSHLNSEKLGRSSGESVSISNRLVHRIHRCNRQISKNISIEKRLEIDEINIELEKLTFVDADELFREILMDAEMLARDLAKEYPEIEINAANIRFSVDGQKLIRNAFVHIIRNSMDHGIEAADVRAKRNKSPAGLIKVTLDVVDNHLRIIYSDDGAGLNINAIRDIAIEKGILSDDSHVPVNELAAFIFHSGFSTSKSVSDISGRGVGMSAIQEYFQNHDGNVEIKVYPDDKDGIADGSVRFELVMTISEKFFIHRRMNNPKHAA